MDLEEQYDKIYRFCYFKVRQREIAEDITQETFLRFFESSDYVDMGKSVQYLYTIARNLCVNEYRKRKMEILNEEASDDDTEDRMITQISVRIALSELSEADRELLLLRYVNEVSVSVICKLYGISRFAVYRRISQALKKSERETWKGGLYMNRKLKDALKNGFEAPKPVKKEEFLRSIQTPAINNFEFVCSQAAYIHKWIWVLSVMIFSVAIIGAGYLGKNMLWCISSFMPLLALTVITESGRSETYGMAEFELSSRFSLKSVVLARLGILGAANLILIGLLIPFVLINSETTVFQTGIYMVCPYLLTVFFGLGVVRKVHGKETIYLCTGIAAGISLGNYILYQSFPLIFGENRVIWWAVVFVILGSGVAIQCYQVIKQTEELVWNL